MKHFKLYNNILGWLTFAIAAATYLLTIEPTASFWDCGEFISSANKLEVGHPPGAPFFILTARMFALFASDATQIAAMVNSMSALLSAFTILFLFWTITHIVRRIITADGKELSVAQGIAALGAGMVGALAYTFSDTFWFSAVEGEVYAYSSLFTAVVFWCILKWEDSESTGAATRWIILIAYLMGLSVGVHLLNLLAIPAIVLIYYFKKYPVTTKGVILSLIVSVIILAAVLYGMIPGFAKVASWFELLFVNGFGCSFNTGLLVYLFITVGIIIWSIYETSTGKNERRASISMIAALSLLGVPFLAGNGVGSKVLGALIIVIALIVLLHRKGWNLKWFNTIVVCFAMLLVGYSSYTLIIVRSLANTPMDQNSPEDVFALQSYLNREQYGDRPLFYGPMYSAPEVLDVVGNHCIPRAKYGDEVWQQEVKASPDQPDRYICTGKRQTGYEMDSRFNMLFPRMYSSNPVHVKYYEQWGDVKGNRISVDRCGRNETRVMPTMGENLRFFFSYQIHFMYWRYFMWNFSGRQNDMQCNGELDKGNWISGFSFLDNARLGDQDAMPDSYKNNRGHNVYYMLPLLLGLLGIFWQLSKKTEGKKQFWVVFTLFFMTGIAIVMYLNQTPQQPRERDYAYAGSFYAFAIWIGIGVMFLYDLIAKITKSQIGKSIIAFIVAVICLGVPAIMAEQNWDDHDRSGRTVARDFGLNYLNSCDEQAILFSNGDNDTFPLWYNQEVEENRTDVRVCNLSYLNTDWYIDQMKREAYESKPLPINWDKTDYREGLLDVSRVYDDPYFNGGALELKEMLSLIRNKKLIDENGIGNVPSSMLYMPLDKTDLLRRGIIEPKDTGITPEMLLIKLRGGSMSKAMLMFLEMLSSNNWERPIYVCATVGEEFYPALQNYMVLEGLAYKIVPTEGHRDRINTDKMYDNMMNKFLYGNIKDPHTYIDEQHNRMARTMRIMMAQLAEELVTEGKNDSALKVVEKALKELPLSQVPADYSSSMLANIYYRIGDKAKAQELNRVLFDECVARLEWNTKLTMQQRKAVSTDMSMRQNIGLLNNLIYSAHQYGDTEFENEMKTYFNKYLPYVEALGE
ncbi:MAG: DUF2723 domain-containing protein [Paludibacteraceae bacterium]|nr:DUF2723 domain-containing protein [Paludibacteraceae bacterium]